MFRMDDKELCVSFRCLIETGIFEHFSFFLNLSPMTPYKLTAKKPLKNRIVYMWVGPIEIHRIFVFEFVQKRVAYYKALVRNEIVVSIKNVIVKCGAHHNNLRFANRWSLWLAIYSMSSATVRNRMLGLMNGTDLITSKRVLVGRCSRICVCVRACVFVCAPVLKLPFTLDR